MMVGLFFTFAMPCLVCFITGRNKGGSWLLPYTDLPPCFLHLPSKPDHPGTLLSQLKQCFCKIILQNQAISSIFSSKSLHSFLHISLHVFPPGFSSHSDLPPCFLHLPSKPDYPATLLSQLKQCFCKIVTSKPDTFPHSSTPSTSYFFLQVFPPYTCSANLGFT